MRYAIGIDLGGTNITGVLINDRYKVLKKIRLKTRKTKKQIIDDITTIIKTLDNKKIKGIGIGVPGFIKDKKLHLVKNIPSLENTNLAKELKKKIKIENDANCFALAESIAGAGKRYKNTAGIIIGTGVGGGIIIDKKIYKGKQSAGEFGHTIIDTSSKTRCRCGNYGDFESLCSGPNLLKRYKGKLKDLKDIFRSDERQARSLIKEFYRYLEISIANIADTLDPDIIVLGGGVSRSINIKKINIKKYTYSDTKIVKNKLGNDSGVIGAGLLVLND